MDCRCRSAILIEKDQGQYMKSDDEENFNEDRALFVKFEGRSEFF